MFSSASRPTSVATTSRAGVRYGAIARFVVVLVAVGASMTVGGIHATTASAAPGDFTNKTSANTGGGLGNNFVRGVYAIGSTVYAATSGGLSISTDGGATFTNKTMGNGLGNNLVRGVYAIGSTVYAATNAGLSISTDGGTSFTNKTTGNGLGNNTVKGVYAIGSSVYAATDGGLSISTDGGTSFTNRTIGNGLGANVVSGLYAIGSTVYAATDGGLSISTDGGATFTNKTTANGLGNNFVSGVYAIGSTVYAATAGGLSISTDGGANFTNKTTANGLGNNAVNGVYASGSTVYAATNGFMSGGGISISTNGGTSFTNYTTSDGLGSNVELGVYAIGPKVYAATLGGLSIGFIPTPPGAMSGVAATPGNASAAMSWTVDDTGGSAVTRIEFAIDDTVTVDDSTTNVAGPQTLTGLVNGQTYIVYTRAVNAIGAGPWSAGTSVTPRTTPSAPTGLVATPGNGSASIAFTPGSDGGSAVTNYAYTLDDSTWIPISPDDTTTPVTITGLANGTTYSVKLRAINTAGSGTASASVPVTPATTPGMLTGIAATPGNTTASLSWTVDDTGGSAVTSIEFAIDDTVTVDDSTTNVTGPYTITGLVNGQAYTVYARAVNAIGAGSWSAGTSVTPQAPPAPVPPRPVPTPTPTPTPTPSPVPTTLPPGDGSLVVDGVPGTATVTPDHPAQQVVVTGGGVSLTVAATDPGGGSLPLAPDGSLLVPADGGIPMSGSGLAAGSEVSMYLFSEPISLGTANATADGTYTAAAALPAGVPVGNHTIQIAGISSSGKAINLSLGITVTAQATITLDAGQRTKAGRHDRVTATGTVTGIPAGTTLTPYIHYAGQKGFTAGRGTITVAADGTFTWTRTVGHSRRISAYVTYTDTHSNTVIWRRIE